MLAAKGYVIGKKGVYDARTSRAVLAFRKVTGKAKNTRADSSVFKALRAGKGTFRVRFPSHGRHVEGDVGKCQVHVRREFGDGVIGHAARLVEGAAQQARLVGGARKTGR